MSPDRPGSTTNPAPESQTLSIRRNYVTALVAVNALQGPLDHSLQAPVLQYPSRLFTMLFSGSPFSNLAYCSRKKRIA